VDVALERLRRGRDRTGVDELPAGGGEQLEVGRLGGMDVERELEALRRARRQLRELAELVQLEAVDVPVHLDPRVGPAPGRDRREAVVVPRGRDRPVVEDDGRPRDAPVHASGRDLAIRAPDVRAEGEEELVAFQAGAAVPGHVPELGEAGVVVEIDAPPRLVEELAHPEVTAEVEQHVRRGGGGEQLLAPGAVEDGAVGGDEPGRAGEPEALGDAAEPLELLKGRRFDLLDKADLCAESPQTLGPTEPRPGVAGVPGLDGESAADERACH